MKIVKSNFSGNCRPIVYTPDVDPLTGSRKASMKYAGKEIVLRSLNSVVGRVDQAIFEIELTEEEVEDLWNKVKGKFENGK